MAKNLVLVGQPLASDKNKEKKEVTSVKEEIAIIPDPVVIKSIIRKY